MTGRRQMGTDLMGPSRDQMHLQNRLLTIIRKRNILCGYRLCLAFCFFQNFHLIGHLIFQKISFDLLTVFYHPIHDREIIFFHGPVS